MKSYRHGEVILTKSTKAQGETKPATSYIIGHSETGHHHVLESVKPFKVTQDKLNRLWIELEAEAKLIHQKQHDVHNTLTIAPGLYEVTKKTEYSPFTKTIEQVRD